MSIFPAPTATALAEADTVLAALPDQALTVIDGLALGAMPDVAAAHRVEPVHDVGPLLGVVAEHAVAAGGDLAAALLAVVADDKKAIELEAGG
mgnify:CR=1 FL=1